MTICDRFIQFVFLGTVVAISPDRDWILIETDTLKPYIENISDSLHRAMTKKGTLERVDELHRIMLTREFEGFEGQRIRVDSRRFYKTSYFFDNVRQKSFRKVPLHLSHFRR